MFAFKMANGSNKEQARIETKLPAIFAGSWARTVPMETAAGSITLRFT